MNRKLSKISLTKFAAAAVIYGGFAVYLFGPHFKHFQPIQYLLPVNLCLSSLGCYVLSRRWVSAFAGSFFAGAIYGFGPFMLGLLKFHPTATFLAASLPWLFCPAAFVPKQKWHWLSAALSALPFLAILLFFNIATHYRLFPIPTQAKLRLTNLVGLLAPLVMAERNVTLVGFYHIPIAGLFMGLSMLLAARRVGIIVIFAVGTILAFCEPFLHIFPNVSPIIWVTIPVLCCSVLIGAGMQGLVLAGFADRKWLLAIAVVLGIAAIVTLLLATIPDFRFTILDLRFMGHDLQLSIGNQQSQIENLFLQSTRMYILGAVALAIILFMARARLRAAFLRQIILYSAMAIDIFLGARFTVDRIF